MTEARPRLDRLLGFLGHLQAHNIPYTLSSVRGEAIMVLVATPGLRWEIEFMRSDWQELVQVERFASIEGVEGAPALDALFSELGIPAMTNL